MHVDVIFVHPKNRYYVVFHQGQFWQLPRLSLTASAWLLKLLYTGELSEIFVAKNQHINDETLAKRLTTTQLPAHLLSISAERFLPWWQANHYRFDKNEAQPPKQAQKTVISPYAKDILAKLKQQSTPTPSIDDTPPSTDSDEFAIFDDLLQQLHNEIRRP